MNAVSDVAERRRLRLNIQGAVQGVGFRPFVYRLATGLGLTGWVVNDTTGVFIEAEGPPEALERFLARLPAELPPRAQVLSLESAWLEPAGYDRFEIRHSHEAGAKTVLVLPDLATCPDCLAEVLSAGDRRFRYPFTNCTNCGPRFSIIRALPYDRPHTTMAGFVMCPDCRREYEDPLDRRFHAQPNACPVCGPQLRFLDRRGGNGREDAEAAFVPLAEGEAALQAAVAALRAGRIVAVKGLGGFHLMADATNEEAVALLRARKRRGDKPFALMVRDLAMARRLCQVSPTAATLLSAVEAPIVLLPRRDEAADPTDPPLSVATAVAPGNPALGLMLPYTPLHHLLLGELDRPVVATSGNLSDEPICTDNDEALTRLAGLADAFLVHNRPIARHVDDSVAWIVAGTPRLLRRARGYAPLPVLLKEPAPTILAVGGHLKNTVALSVGRQVFISQHIGDLETAEAMAAFERVIADFLRLYEAQPVAIAHDLHPAYASTRYALEAFPEAIPRIAVQHHHAHLAACLADNGVAGPALGVTWDGTGYGPDETVWGGEFLLGDARGYTRVAHLRPFRLPGGDAAVYEPRRVALALLWALYGEAALAWEDLPPVAACTPAERRVLARMLAGGFRAPWTTSMGRLFDGVAALIGLQQRVSYEGQAAMRLEFVADPAETTAYPFDLVTTASPDGSPAPITLDWGPLLEAVIADVREGVPVGTIAGRFHNALVDALVRVAEAVGHPRVALTGGCFQNRLLTERSLAALQAAGFEVLLHRQVPPNDGGISLGQIAVAAVIGN